jgi:hypothetical protein
MCKAFHFPSHMDDNDLTDSNQLSACLHGVLFCAIDYLHKNTDILVFSVYRHRIEVKCTKAKQPHIKKQKHMKPCREKNDILVFANFSRANSSFMNRHPLY